MNDLKEARESRGISQRQLAERCHVSPSIISDIELGKRLPYPKLRKRISRILGIPQSDLFGQKEVGSKGSSR